MPHTAALAEKSFGAGCRELMAPLPEACETAGVGLGSAPALGFLARATTCSIGLPNHNG